jgi:hypothetical protein
LKHFRLAIACGLLVLVIPAGAGAVLEGHDSFCGACHTQPEVEYLERSSAPASDLASSHAEGGTGCIDCHSGGGLTGRVGSLVQGATDLAAYLSGDYARPSVTAHPVGDEGCTKCHGQPSARPDISSPAAGISSSHYHFSEYTTEWDAQQPQASGICVVCHAAHAQGMSTSQGYRIAAQVNASCEACHRALSGWVPPIE